MLGSTCTNLGIEKMGDQFTPLESHAVCSGNEDNSLIGANPVRDLSLNGANTGFNAPCEPSR